MSTKFIKGLPVAILALAMTNTAFADRDDRGDRGDRRGEACGGSGYCCPVEVCEAVAAIEMCETVKPNCCRGPVLCPAYPTCIECYNMEVDIGFIYEQFRLTQTDYGFLTFNAPGALPKTATILRPKFDLEWGVTASLGYFMEHDNWFFDITFDWLRAKNKRFHRDCEFNEFIEPTHIWRSDLIAGDCFRNAESVCEWFRINYFMLQFDLERATYLSTFFSIEPHMGLRVSWFFFHNKTEFFDLNNGTLPTAAVFHDQKTHFWGIGPVWGVNMRFDLCQGFSLYLDDNLGLLFGDSRDRDHINYGQECGCPSFDTFAKQRLQVMSPFAQIVIGVEWNRCICDNTQAVRIKAGLDTTHYWNNWSHINVINEAPGCGGICSPCSFPSFNSADDAEVSLIGLRVDFAWDF